MRTIILVSILLWWLIFKAVAAFGEPLSVYSPDSYSYFGTLGDASTFLGRYGYEAKLTNKGKLEGKGDGSDVPTWDISTDSDFKRTKMGGGSDTNTAHGGRSMWSGNNALYSPGSVLHQAGKTDNIGEDGKGAFLALYTSACQPIIFGTCDQQRKRIDPDGVWNTLQRFRVAPGKGKFLEYRVRSRRYFVPLVDKRELLRRNRWAKRDGWSP